MSPGEEKRLLELLEILDGSRSKVARKRRAIRLEDLAPLLEIPQRLQSVVAAGAAPTKAEYDALRRDLELIRGRLFAVQALLQALL